MPDNITLENLENNLAFFNKMYDVVRLVDPVDKKVIEYQGNSRSETDEICYLYWKNGEICDNCISVRAHLSNKCFVKLEQASDAIMMVTAFSVENADTPTVIELLKNATDTMLIGSSGNYSDGRLMRNVVTEINDLVIKDELTGLYNRRYVDERLPVDIVRATLGKLPLSVIFMDIDNLKEINDTYGHVYGDKTFDEVTRTLLHCIRTDNDWAARYGGDEFLICLNNTSGEAAYQIAERIRCGIAGIEALYQNKRIYTTVSIGIYTMYDEKMTAEELISLADQRMYKAKKNGKNRSFCDSK
ncbi:MAG: GGDEF domain-containing protein [Flexilinea sp.]